MKRPWLVWVSFAVAVVAVLGSLALISQAVLVLDREEGMARRAAAFEETVRLSLWRMDSALSSLVIRESARPYFVYSAFHPAERAYSRMYAELQPGDVMIPSPLLTSGVPFVLLHFQIGSDGVTTSPAAPSMTQRSMAERAGADRARIQQASTRLGEIGASVDSQMLASLLPSPETSGTATPVLFQAPVPTKAAPDPAAEHQQALNVAEWNVRQQQQGMQQMMTKERPPPVNRPPAAAAPVLEGLMTPLWVDDKLVLARRVTVGKSEYIQGCWLDWDAIQAWLLSEIDDLLPNARLVKARLDAPDAHARTLAALPVRLEPGPMPPPHAEFERSPLVLSLFIAWPCALIAIAALGAMLARSVSLGERRAAFVSAVTHELRTPLTTLRMYTEMLDEGIVHDSEQAAQYIRTLRGEAERLGHLVENVLAYSRLERGRGPASFAVVSLGDLIERVRPRLAQHAERAGMTLLVEIVSQSDSVELSTDPGAVEQILLNLVDNACKYAGSAEDRRIHIIPVSAGGQLAVTVRDHGPGLGNARERRLFTPFHRGAREAAGNAPGVGLGLALSRRLARSLGGDLRIDRNVAGANGAAFRLTLPVRPPR